MDVINGNKSVATKKLKKLNRHKGILLTKIIKHSHKIKKKR